MGSWYELFSPGITINFLFNPIFIKSGLINNKEKDFAQINCTPSGELHSAACYEKAIFKSGACIALKSLLATLGACSVWVYCRALQLVDFSRSLKCTFLR